AKATSLLNHKNIVKILDFGAIESGIPYMVLEYIPGQSLFKQLERHRSLPWQTTVDIFVEICRALDYAHKEGVMHRD
ncbi:MAG TPA: protein kinase, partial [Candidatus Melainabacteria bacterium]|nr:protein kinase [Candidatus Melainabacteria bacterium]